MKYSSVIDNQTSKKWGLNIQLAYLFDWIYSLPSWASSVTIEGKQFYFASKTKAIEDLSLLTDKPDTMYRYYKALEEFGLVVIKKVDNKDYVMLTDKAKEWNTKNDYSSEHSEKNPTNSEKNPNLARKKIRHTRLLYTDKIITDNTPFDLFWSQYGKKVDRVKAEKIWNKISDSDKLKIMDHLKKYIPSTPDVTYRKNPSTYLNNRAWENEVIENNNNGKRYTGTFVA